MFPSSAANEPQALTEGVRVEQALELRGRPCVVCAWFTRPEPDVGLLRPQLVAAFAVDPDGVVYEDLDRDDIGRETLERLRTRAAELMEV